MEEGLVFRFGKCSSFKPSNFFLKKIKINNIMKKMYENEIK
jgi:hypothetical protein